MDYVTALITNSSFFGFSGFLLDERYSVGGDSIDEIERCFSMPMLLDAICDEVVIHVACMSGIVRILNTNTRFRITGTRTSIGVSSGDPH